jgi:hypothetical protein
MTWRARAATRAGDPARARALLAQAKERRGFLARMTQAEIRQAEGDAEAEEEIRTLEDREARFLAVSREAARESWPEAAPKLVTLARLARELGHVREASAYARLAVEADPDLPAAHRVRAELPGHPFLRLHSLARWIESDPEDPQARALRRALRAQWKLDGAGGSKPAARSAKR